MQTFLVPGDVQELLDGSAFRVVGAAGPDGIGWLAAATDGSGRALEVHVVTGVLDDVTTARAERLRHVTHDHLPAVHDVVQIGPGRTALVVEHVTGPTLAELRSQRAPLSDGEAVTVAVPVAEALAALHDAGLVHGAVSPASVVVRPDGRPALVDLRGALAGSGSPDGDVRRLVATVLALVPDADVHLLAGPHDGSLRDALEELVTAGDVTAAQLVDRCFATAEPEPVRLPDAGARAALDLARHGAGAGAGLHRPRRPPRRVPRPLLLGGVVGALLVAAVVTALTVLPGRPGAPVEGQQAPPRVDAAAAATALTVRRGEILASGDAARLDEVEVVDGPAHRADVALVGSLAGSLVDGLTIRVDDAVAQDPPPDASTPAPGTEVRVRVTSVVSAHRRVGANGATTEVPATVPRSVVLTLRWTADGWRVWDVT